jgi:hypothetical protein
MFFITFGNIFFKSDAYERFFDSNDSLNQGMSNSNQLAVLVVLTMKYTTRTASNEQLELLGVFLLLITIKNQFKMPNIVIYTNF